VSVTDMDVEVVTCAIWEALFSLPLTRTAPTSPPLEPSVTGIVHIDGAWAGALVMQCPLDLAHRLTVMMLDSGAPGTAGEPPDDDVRDVIGEVANMLAGNLKALLPEPCRISLPAVAFGSDVHMTVPRTAVEAAASFECGGRALAVTLLLRTATGRP